MSDHSIVLNFESLKFNLFYSSEEIITDKSFDPDLNFFNSNIGNLDTPYISHEEHKNLNVNGSEDTLFILHLNIRTIKKFIFFLSNLTKFLCTINNEIIFKNSSAGLKSTIFIHIKIYKIKTILVSELHFLSSVV